MCIADSVVVITGASSGMGKEITYRYAERGCKIVIGARNLKELNAVREDKPLINYMHGRLQKIA